jgi:DNA-binding transcriptional LysR family regulator
MDLRQLRSLDAVARHRSFTQAALELHVAQSALSQQVAKLERELGVELLRRTTRRVEVTDAGELVLARARRAIAEVEDIRADLDALSGLLRGRLRLGGVPPVGPLHPAKMIAEFSRAHPGIDITVQEDVARVLLDRLAAGGLDLVMSLTDPADVPAGVDGRRLAQEELVVIAAPDHPLAKRRRVPLAALHGEPLVAYGPGSALREVLEREIPDARFVAEANELDTVRELVALGLGVTLMPIDVVGKARGRFAVRPLAPKIAVPVSLMWRAADPLSPAARAFRDHVFAAVGVA